MNEFSTNTTQGYSPNPSEKFVAIWIAIAIIITALLIAWLFSGCCSTPPQILTRVDTIIVNKVINGVIKPDTVLRWYWKDSTLQARVDTVTQELWYRINHTDTVIHTDTTAIYKNVIQQKTFTETVELWLFPVLCGALSVCCIIVGFPIVLKLIKPI